LAIKIGVGLFTGQIPPTSARTFHTEYSEILELVQLVEETGLDGAWVSEHHFSEDGYLPSLLPMLAAFAAVTERIELGTGVVLAPFHDPIRLAEDFAVVDQISGGRVVCGLGIGWRDEEFREFGIDVRTRPRRLEEITEILRLSWSERRFDYQGRHYRYDGVAVTPKPHRPIPILIGGFVDEAVMRAGRLGDGYISSRVSPERARETFAMAAEARAEAGREGPPIVALLHNAYVTEDPEGDWGMIRDGAGHQLGTYAAWRARTDVPGVPLEVMPPDEETIRKSTAYGRPEEVVAHLEPIVDILNAYSEAHLILRLHYPGMNAEPAARAIELLAGEVAPRLRQRAST
jgi:probable F420-dependent oxidoreductase